MKYIELAWKIMKNELHVLKDFEMKRVPFPRFSIALCKLPLKDDSLLC
jgi:hypothetical protein